MEAEDFLKQETVEWTGYAWGSQKCDVGVEDCLAKLQYNKDTLVSTYFVKYGASGPERGCFYNPVSPTFGRTKYVFRKVTRPIFDLYIKFLETSNPVHCKHAERLMAQTL